MQFVLFALLYGCISLGVGIKMLEENNLLTVEETLAVLKSRGIELDLEWLRNKARNGKIEGAVKFGNKYRGFWLIPRVWAETYTKSTKGRKRATTE